MLVLTEIPPHIAERVFFRLDGHDLHPSLHGQEEVIDVGYLPAPIDSRAGVRIRFVLCRQTYNQFHPDERLPLSCRAEILGHVTGQDPLKAKRIRPPSPPE